MTRSASGFSLIELLLAMAILATCAGALLALIAAGQSIARMQPEAADLQQRARIAAQTLGGELARAGAGLDTGPSAGTLAQYFPPVVPSADGGVTIWYVSGPDAQATLGAPLAVGATDATIGPHATCPAADPACVFTAGTTAILFDGGACHDLARIDQVNAASLLLRAGSRGCAYPAGTPIAEGEVRTYRVDPIARQLLRRDEATGVSFPVLDNVAAMGVECLDGGRRVRLTLRLVSTLLLGVPDLVLPLDVAPPNLQGAW